VRGRAGLMLVEEEGRQYWRLTALTVAPGELAFCTLYFEDATDREWAIETWRSLRYQAPEEVEEE
jgi:hypothetical protein